MEIASLVETHLDLKKLFDLDHLNFVIEQVMCQCRDDEAEFYMFGKQLTGRHGWGVAAKHYIQYAQLKNRGADQEILKLALAGNIEAAKLRLKQYEDAIKLLERVRVIKRRIIELEG
jgi:hypothetical protein